MKKSDLASMTIAELKTLAKKNKLAVPSTATKADLIRLLTGGAKKAVKTAAKKTAAKSPKRTAQAAPAKRKAAAKAIAKTTAKKRTAKAAKPARTTTTRPDEKWNLPPGIEEPLMAQERVELAKYFTGRGAPQVQPSRYSELPAGYGEDQIVLMARDPEIAFVYWEVTPERLEREQRTAGRDSVLCIRLYDITGIRFNGENATGYSDQEVPERIGSWYFNIGRPGHSFAADIGLRTPDGRFRSLARSNSIVLPGDRPSGMVDGEWQVSEEEFRKLYGIGTAPSSQEQAAGQWVKRDVVGGISSAGISSPGMYMRKVSKGQGNA